MELKNLVIVLFGLSIMACQKADFENPSDDFSQNPQLMQLSPNHFNQFEAIVYDENVDCSVDCIEEGIGDYYILSDMATGGNNQNTKKVSYNAYNTETSFVVEVTYEIIAGNSNAKADITITIAGDVVLIEDVASGTTVQHAIPLPASWAACDVIDFSILQEALGQPISFDASYELIAVCGCEESFYYTLQNDGSYVFSYTSEESLTGAVVKFTCPHITDFESLDLRVYTENPGNGQGSPTVLSWTGDIPACEEISFHLAFDPDCDQNNAGFALLFTDFKVNEVSKKGDAENIKFDCED